MGVLRRRTRAVNFRITEQEFEELQRASIAEGAASISDFARTAVYRFIREVPEAVSAQAQIRRIDRRLHRLERHIEGLLECLKDR